MKRTLRAGGRAHEVELRRVEEGKFVARVDGEPLEIDVAALGDGWFRLETTDGSRLACMTRDSNRRYVTLNGQDHVFEVATAAARGAGAQEHAGGEVAIPMPGRVIAVRVAEGERVTRGQPLLVVEAMKMEHTLHAPRDGTVRNLRAEAGKQIEGGAVLLEVAE